MKDADRAGLLRHCLHKGQTTNMLFDLYSSAISNLLVSLVSLELASVELLSLKLLSLVCRFPELVLLRLVSVELLPR